MKPVQSKVRLSNWTEEYLSSGKTAFSMLEVRKAFPTHSEMALQLALNRLAKKGKVLSIFKGYYLIIPPQYYSLGIMPPTLFIDGLMRYLNRQYYLGLLNAAAIHGAAHQQPQEFFVFTIFPVMRNTFRKGLKINYISRKEISSSLLEERKTETGYVKISSPELTAADLIQFEKHIGGLNRAVAVLKELVEEMKEERFNKHFVQMVPTSIIQRMGFLLEYKLDRIDLADSLFTLCKEEELTLFRTLLKPDKAKKGYPVRNRWNVIKNIDIETEE